MAHSRSKAGVLTWPPRAGPLLLWTPCSLLTRSRPTGLPAASQGLRRNHTQEPRAFVPSACKTLPPRVCGAPSPNSFKALLPEAFPEHVPCSRHGVTPPRPPFQKDLQAGAMAIQPTAASSARVHLGFTERPRLLTEGSAVPEA